MFWFVFNDKIVAINSASSVTDRLPLVQVKYSLNSYSSQSVTNHVLNGLAFAFHNIKCREGGLCGLYNYSFF